MVYTGTSHFVSFDAAYLYYLAYGDTREGVKAKIERGEISIGKPPIKQGESLMVRRDEGRYIIKGT